MSEIVRDIIWLPIVRPTPRQIMRRVAQLRGITVDDIIGESRKRPIAHARQETMWELRQRTRLSLPHIGLMLGGRDHTTVLHGVRAHEARMAERQGEAA